jgi:hypothetical protein
LPNAGITDVIDLQNSDRFEALPRLRLQV